MSPNSLDLYPRISLETPSRKRHFYVHRIVAAAFIGPCPEGYEVNHKDGNKNNAAVSNLEYVTPRQNAVHAVNVLGHHRGEHHHWAKLKEDDVRAIRNLAGSGCPVKQIARQFGVSLATTYKVISRETWSYVA
jgi:hypothetical protein